MDLIFFITLFLFVLLFGTLDNGIDFDFWARLVVGKSFFQTGALFNNDFQSFGTTHEFIDHEWGSSLVFYFIQSNFGDIGLFVFKSLIIFFTLYFLIKIIRLEDSKIKLNFLFFFFALQSISYTIFATIRCQTFSFFFFAFYLYILKYIVKTKNHRLLWCFPVLNIIWANMHGGFVLGLALIFVFAIGEFLNDRKSKSWLYFLITFFVTLTTSLINPYGIDYIIYIIDAFKLNRIHIVEWQSAFFNERYIYALPKFKIFFGITILLFAYAIVRDLIKKGFKNFYQDIDKTKYLLLLFVTLIALKALRCHVFFAYSVLALCYCDFYNIFNKKLPNLIECVKDVVIFILISISTLSHLYDYRFVNIINERYYPIYCVEFLKQNNIKGNIFANFHYGSYIAYKLYPDNFVFMDGRYEEVYDNELINMMADVFRAKTHKEFFNKFHCDIIISEKKYPLSEALKSDKNWFLAWEDERFVMYLSNEYKEKKYLPPKEDIHYYDMKKFETKIDWIN